MHTDDDLAQARDEAFHAGHEAALVAARELEERQIKELFQTIGQRIEDLTATRADDNQRLAVQATDVAVSICRKLLPELSRRHAMTEIEGLIGDCLASMPDEPRIVVRVADALVDQLQRRIDTIANGFAGKLVLLGDDEMADTDCAVVWADGGTERNLARLWREVENALARLGVGKEVAPPASDNAEPPSAEAERRDPTPSADEPAPDSPADETLVGEPFDAQTADATNPITDPHATAMPEDTPDVLPAAATTP